MVVLPAIFGGVVLGAPCVRDAGLGLRSAGLSASVRDLLLPLLCRPRKQRFAPLEAGLGVVVPLLLQLLLQQLQFKQLLAPTLVMREILV